MVECQSKKDYKMLILKCQKSNAAVHEACNLKVFAE